MLERGSGARLAEEPRPGVGVFAFGEEHFEGDASIEALVAREVDGAHAALSERAFDEVPLEAIDGAEHGRRL
jgi:hypothetical protein